MSPPGSPSSVAAPVQSETANTLADGPPVNLACSTESRVTVPPPPITSPVSVSENDVSAETATASVPDPPTNWMPPGTANIPWE